MHAQGMADPLEGVLHPTAPKIVIRNLRIHDDYDEGADGLYSTFWGGTR